MGTDSFSYSKWGSDWVTTTTTGDFFQYTGNGAFVPPPEPKPAGPLAWLDERVGEIEDMGRELLEAH